MTVFRKDYVRDGAAVSVRVEALDGGRYRVRVGEDVMEVQARALEDGAVQFSLEDEHGAIRQHTAYGCADADRVQVRLDGLTWTLQPAGRRRGGAGAQHGSGQVFAPMTGTVLEVRVEPGDRVEADRTLILLSAMKMEHKLVAGVAGTVASVQAVAGTTVEQGDLLAEVEPDPAH